MQSFPRGRGGTTPEARPSLGAKVPLTNSIPSEILFCLKHFSLDCERISVFRLPWQ